MYARRGRTRCRLQFTAIECAGGDDYQDLLPGHVLSVDHRELDCFRINVPQGLAAVAIEVLKASAINSSSRREGSDSATGPQVRDKSRGDMLQVRVGRQQQNFPSAYDQARAAWRVLPALSFV
jgi:hypothetical protein